MTNRIVHPCADPEGTHRGWMIMCPACGFGHLFDSRWTFNGNLDKPTFTPSMLTNAVFTPEQRKEYNIFRCHSFVTDGRIQFLDDCDHPMKGQTVDLEPF